MKADQSRAEASNSQSPKARSINAVLAYDDRQFVESAYQLILDRNPDSGGLNYYLARLRGGARKLQILNELSSSEEARARCVEVPDLRKALRRQGFINIPVLGGLFKWLSGLEGDSVGEVKMRAIQHQFYSVKEELAALERRQDEVLTQITSILNSIARFEQAPAHLGWTSSQEAAIATLKQRQLTFETEQLPTLLQTLTNINHRQMASDSDRDNLVKSVPIALRKMVRDIAELGRQQKSLLDMTERGLIDVRQQLISASSNPSRTRKGSN